MKIGLYRYSALASEKPDDLYGYVKKNGLKESVWVYNDMLEALEALPNFETTCKKEGDVYKIVFYALEREKK